ncbi:MAG: CpsD/CapB family tyrosine-protein kinase [Clostridiales bacterium]|nr:CpsD/CapB family tyrosine-protein kinase [Candidatus Equinaster intestinalis]
MRKSRTHRYLGITRKCGITNYLCGLNTVDEVIKHTDSENLDIITSGDIPPNPAELIASESFAEMMKELKSRYDYIFIDTPPLNIVTDGIIAMKYCSGVVLVVRLGMTTYDMMDKTVADIKMANTKILGSVVIGAGEKKPKYGRKGYYGKYNYNYKYNYKYKYEYTDKTSENGKNGETDK